MAKEFIVKATFETDKKTGKRKITDLHFPMETIRSIIDMSFIKTRS